ncbi:hypothetical protein GGS20DRAFT_584601 [Poronia punctata]|nr:hypothetical protein GGS20DRAFT_584601 [Poronia punctata]
MADNEPEQEANPPDQPAPQLGPPAQQGPPPAQPAPQLGTPTQQGPPPAQSGPPPQSGPPAQPNPPTEGRFICKYCRKCCTTKPNLHQHIQDNHVGLRCRWPHCTGLANSERDLRRHLQRHQKEVVKSGAPPLMCGWPGTFKKVNGNDLTNPVKKRNPDYDNII